MLIRYFCVINERDRILYLGPSIDRTARLLEPGCWYGWGETEAAARADAERRKGVRG